MSATVLVLGSGSREHAIAWKLAQSAHVQLILVAPGNGGTASAGGKIANLDLNLKNNSSVVAWCKTNKPDLVVVGPEDPLDRGIADDLAKIGTPCFGPSSAAAQIECNKCFSKDFMARHSIPTARYETFTDAAAAKKFIRNATFKALVVKASGLAAGKGVIVAKDVNGACDAVDLIMSEKAFGDAGQSVVVEELLEGQEVSVLAFTDGTTIYDMPGSQDHKRAYDGDEGPNTGGMGAYCPCPFLTAELKKQVQREILERAVSGLRAEGKPFVGVLYAGIILTVDGAKVIEFNCRFGDPETQTVLTLLDSDLFEIFIACTKKTLSTLTLKWKQHYACGVVIASGGYPASATKGVPILNLAEADASGVIIFHGGTERKSPTNLVTSGGRVLTVVGIADNLAQAAQKAQEGASLIKIDKSFFRKDIASKALAKQSLTYRASGVDIDAGERLVDNIKLFAKQTVRSGVMESIGGFGALFDLKASGYEDPILVSGTDGVGTKLKVAIETKIYDTVGIDLVAMCVNDILVQGAEPLYFLDYFACAKLDVTVASQVISGIARGCHESGCALVGGETAEMPGMYAKDDFDLAGFAVGAVNRKGMLPRKEDIQDGDVLIGLPSSGVHSNGFSLVRKILAVCGKSFADAAPFAIGKTFGEVLLTPTKIYVQSLLPVIKSGQLKALSHITGGGLLDNIPRILTKEFGVVLDANHWRVPEIYKWLKEAGNLDETEMLRTFNCGIGMVCIVHKSSAGNVLKALKLNGEPDASIIGHVVKRTGTAVTVHNFFHSLQSPSDEKRAKRVAVLISGSGTNLQALLDHTLDTRLRSAANIALVISNVADAKGLDRAARVGVPTKVIPHKGRKREEFDDDVHQALVEAQIDIVCLAGFMRILSEKFVKRWEGRLINVHPSLLPSFKGMNTHEEVLQAGVRVHGCTVHFVDSGVDTGAILMQQPVMVNLDDTPSTLQERVKLEAEHRIYPLALESLARGEVQLDSATKRAIWKI